MVAQSARESCQLDGPVPSVVKVKNQLLLFLLHFGRILLAFLLLLVTGHHLVDILVLLVLGEVGICLAVEEHDVYVAVCAPTSVAAVSVLVGCPCHRLALERPSEASVAVSALGEIGDLSGLKVYEGDILIVPSSVRLVVAQDISAVRTPFK